MRTHTISIEQALLRAQCASHLHASCGPACEYALEHCPTFWRKVFVYYYGADPHGIDDATEPRWNVLFKEGYAVLRAQQTERRTFKTAS